ncbi:MAG: tetratricopeptide repeat protein [Anaerolineae bacterium]
MKKNTRLLVLAGVLLALVLVSYSNHFNNAFQFDDDHTIVSNTAIRDLRNIPSFFTDVSTTSSLPQNQSYRPGVTTLNAIDYALGSGLVPYFFHRSIFISFLILGVLLYLFFVKIAQLSSDWPWLKALALVAAGWYMLHTANAETINYIIQRADSFSTLMVVLAFVVYQYKPRWRRYYIYLVPVVVGALVKQPALMFAPLLFLYNLLFEAYTGAQDGARFAWRTRLGRSLKAALPAFVVSLGMGIFILAMTPTAATPNTTPWPKYLITQPFVMVHYINNFFLPLQLSADSDWRPLTTMIDDRFFVGMVGIGIIIAIAIWAVRRKETRPISYGLLWFLVALLPTSVLVPLDEVLNDHRTFFPYIGLVLACSWAVGLLISRFWSVLMRSPLLRVALGCLVGMVLLGNAYGVYQRNQVWSTPESLWRDAALKSPANPRALMNYGLSQMEKGNYDVALDYFNRALVLAPTYSYLHVNLGILYGAMNRPAEAERYLQNGIAYAPNNPGVYYYYANWLNDQQRIDEAKTMVQKALAISPGYAPAQQLASRINSASLFADYINESVTFYNAGDFQMSLLAAQKAVDANPNSAIAYNNICAACNRLGLWDQAIDACRTALALDPELELAMNNLAVAQYAKQ